MIVIEISTYKDSIVSAGVLELCIAGVLELCIAGVLDRCGFKGAGSGEGSS